MKRGKGQQCCHLTRALAFETGVTLIQLYANRNRGQSFVFLFLRKVGICVFCKVHCEIGYASQSSAFHGKTSSINQCQNVNFDKRKQKWVFRKLRWNFDELCSDMNSTFYTAANGPRFTFLILPTIFMWSSNCVLSH